MFSPQAQATQRRCPQCVQAMNHLALDGHARSGVLVDHCAACRLVWFDALESVGLSALGWVQLLRELQQGTDGHRADAVSGSLSCPVCTAALKPVHNHSRFGRFPALECRQRHGHLHSHAGLLAERGLVRPLLGPERRALAEERRQLGCLNCGAPSDGRGERCSYCGSTLVVLDLPRLAHALRLRRGRMGPSPVPSGQPLVGWACRGCGAPLDPSSQSRCEGCGHLVVVPSLLDLTPLLDTVEAEIRSERLAEEGAALARRAALAARGQRGRHWRDTGLARLLHWLRMG